MKRVGASAELQQRLEDLKQARDGNTLKEKMRKNAVKYHMVKFLERKRVTRLIRQIDSQIKTLQQQQDALESVQGSTSSADKSSKKNKSDKNKESKDSKEIKQLLKKKEQLEDDLTYIMCVHFVYY